MGAGGKRQERRSTLRGLLPLEAQLAAMAERLNQLYRQRTGLVALLRSIREHGGVTERDWRMIDRVLASRMWQDDL